jgi:hypothetical protein
MMAWDESSLNSAVNANHSHLRGADLMRVCGVGAERRWSIAQLVRYACTAEGRQKIRTSVRVLARLRN